MPSVSDALPENSRALAWKVRFDRLVRCWSSLTTGVVIRRRVSIWFAICWIDTRFCGSTPSAPVRRVWICRRSVVFRKSASVGKQETRMIQKRRICQPTHSHPNLTVINPKMWPWFGSSRDRRLNRWLLSRQLAPLIAKLPQPVVGITTLPITADLPDALHLRSLGLLLRR